LCGEKFRVGAARPQRERNAFAGAADEWPHFLLPISIASVEINFKIDQRIDAEGARLFQIRVARDANDENAEKQRAADDCKEAKEKETKSSETCS